MTFLRSANHHPSLINVDHIAMIQVGPAMQGSADDDPLYVATAYDARSRSLGIIATADTPQDALSAALAAVDPSAGVTHEGQGDEAAHGHSRPRHVRGPSGDHGGTP